MARVDECFKCGAKEDEIELVYSTDKPVLCENCFYKGEEND